MGGGNAQKTAMSRARNQAKAEAEKNSGGGVCVIIIIILSLSCYYIIITLKAKGMSERKGGNMAEAMLKAQGNYIIINYSFINFINY